MTYVHGLLMLHFICLAVGIGGSAANLIAGPVAAGAAPEAKPSIGLIQRRIGIAAFASLILLWVTGYLLVMEIHGAFAGLGQVFTFKIVAVAILTLFSLRMQWLGMVAGRSGTPPPPQTMRVLGMGGALFALLALILAVLSFN